MNTRPVLINRAAMMRGAANVGTDYPHIRGALPSSAAVLLTTLVRGYFADDPARGEEHLAAIESIFILRERNRDNVPMHTRRRSAAYEAWAYLAQHGIVAEPAPKKKGKKR